MMDREASEDESAVDQPSYFCYKAYVKVYFFHPHIVISSLP